MRIYLFFALLFFGILVKRLRAPINYLLGFVFNCDCHSNRYYVYSLEVQGCEFTVELVTHKVRWLHWGLETNFGIMEVTHNQVT